MPTNVMILNELTVLLEFIHTFYAYFIRMVHISAWHYHNRPGPSYKFHSSLSFEVSSFLNQRHVLELLQLLLQ